MSAELALVGARIRTLDPQCPTAVALAISDGVISAVGSEADVRACCDGATEVIDCRGAAIVPGLVDSHQHPFHGAEDTRGVDLSGLSTLAEVQAALRAEHDRLGEGEWVRGFSLEYAVFAGGPITSAAIDEAVRGAPSYLTFFDFHTVLASTAGLAAGSVDGPRTFADTSEIVCADGVPTGELREPSAYNLVKAAIPQPTHAEKLDLYADALARMNACGLTGVHGMDGTPETFRFCRELEARGDLTARLVVPLTVDPGTPLDEQESWLALRDERGALWRGGVAKFFIDGVIEPGTAWLYEPDTNGLGRLALWPDPDDYAAAVARFARAGFQCVTHAVGDRAVRAALDAYRAAGRHGSAPHRIEHLETLQDADLARVAAEGVIASMQASHQQWMNAEGSDPWSSALGPERTARAFRTRELLESGATLALGSDWPVARFDPREGLAWAQLRRAPGKPQLAAMQPQQRLTGLEAIAGYTTGAAAAIGEQAVSGRIAVGYRADLSGFAGDPAEVPPDELAALPVTLTVVAGRVVFGAI